MKQSWLWKHVESQVGDRGRRMMRGNETGVAMLMALIFVVILIDALAAVFFMEMGW